MNIFSAVIIVLVLAILVIFLIIRNRKDEKEFEGGLEEDQDKPIVHHDTDSGERQKI